MGLSDEEYRSLLGEKMTALFKVSLKVREEAQKILGLYTEDMSRLKTEMTMSVYTYKGKATTVMRRGQKNYRCVVNGKEVLLPKEVLHEETLTLREHTLVSYIDKVGVYAFVVGIRETNYKGYYELYLLPVAATTGKEGEWVLPNKVVPVSSSEARLIED